MKKSHTSHLPSYFMLQFAIVAVLASVAAPVEASDWVGAGVTTNWTEAANWSFFPPCDSDMFPCPAFITGDVFGGGHTRMTVNQAWNLSELTFTNHVLSNNLYTVSGSELTIRGGGVNNTSGVNGQRVNNDITLVSPSNGPGNIWSVNHDMIVVGDIGGEAMLRKFGNGKLSLRGRVALNSFIAIEGTVRLGLGDDILADDMYVDVPGQGRLETASTGSETIGNFSGYGHVVLNSHLAIGSANTGDNFYGQFSGPGGWTKVGTGDMFLDRPLANAGPHHSYTGPTTVDGGVLEVRDRARLPNASQLVVNSAGTFRLSGPTDAVFGLDGSGIVDLNAGHLVLGNFVSTGNFPGNGDFSGRIEGTGALSKRGNGTQTLSGASTYSGNTTVAEGTLIVANATGSATGTGTVTVESAGTLVGDGQITGQLNVSGAIAPSGSLTVQNVTFQSGSSLQLDIDGTTSGSGYDQMLATSVTQGGTLEITLGPNYTEPTAQGQWDEFTLIESNSFDAAFDEVRYESALIELGYIPDHASGDGFFRHLTNDGSALALVNYRALPGDANGDSVVDGADFLAWNTNKFSSGTNWTTGDFNSDGTTDGQDFLVWNTHKFTSADLATGINAVPEPNGLVLLILALTLLVDLHHRQRPCRLDLQWRSQR